GGESEQGQDVEDDRHHEGEVRELRELLIDHCALPSEGSCGACEGRSGCGRCAESRGPSCTAWSVVARARTSSSSMGSSLRARPATSSTAPSAVERTRTHTRRRGTNSERISPPTAIRALTSTQRS